MPNPACVAYYAYAYAMAGLAVMNGGPAITDPVTEFDDLPENEQHAWWAVSTAMTKMWADGQRSMTEA